MVRMKTRIGALIGLLVVVVVVILIGGYWYVKDRLRRQSAREVRQGTRPAVGLGLDHQRLP